ncbi:hypothetical protein [Thetidibacter halocola]|uniref:Uncharacterized protein n=1 Tax=Thetidibacter halocola TaxID=2827239 RepID=A0A8J8BA96_9RHOB|nr:hypothetical protein [Thetidibacter halocola]MBS0126315.1 hypothetical protein [Thetidibacter halocola]
MLLVFWMLIETILYFYAALAWCFVAFASVRAVAVGPILTLPERRAGAVFCGLALALAIGITKLAQWL